MQPGSRATICLSATSALLLAVALAGVAVAGTWSEPLVVGNSEASLFADGSTAVVVYVEAEALFVRHSTDAGATWASATQLAPAVVDPAIGGFGQEVDAVWVADNEVHYARSTDGGASFEPSRVVASPSGATAALPLVSRGPNGLVALAWNEWQVKPDDAGVLQETGPLLVRVSTNGGELFGEPVVLAIPQGVPGWGPPTKALATGSGVVYVAYHAEGRLVLQPSVGPGFNWGDSGVIAENQAGMLNSVDWQNPSLAASGSEAYVAYTSADDNRDNSWVRYRRSADLGASWSPPIDMSSPKRWAHLPILSLQGGVLRAIFARCEFAATKLEPYCDLGSHWESSLIYRESPDGVHWTGEEEAVPSSGEQIRPLGLGFAGRVLVLYHDLGFESTFVRGGAPSSLPPAQEQSPAGLPVSDPTPWWMLGVVAVTGAALAFVLYRRMVHRA